MVKHLRGDIWMRDDGVYFKTTRPRAIGVVYVTSVLFGLRIIVYLAIPCHVRLRLVVGFLKKSQRKKRKNYG